jgi:hypothetical protein
MSLPGQNLNGFIAMDSLSKRQSYQTLICRSGIYRLLASHQRSYRYGNALNPHPSGNIKQQLKGALPVEIAGLAKAGNQEIKKPLPVEVNGDICVWRNWLRAFKDEMICAGHGFTGHSRPSMRRSTIQDGIENNERRRKSIPTGLALLDLIT